MIKLKIDAIEYETHKRISIIRYFNCDKKFEQYEESPCYILDGIYVPGRIVTKEMQAYDFIVDIKEFKEFLNKLIYDPNKELEYIIDFEVIDADYKKKKKNRKKVKSELEQLLEILNTENTKLKLDFSVIYHKLKNFLRGNIYNKFSQVLNSLNIAYDAAINAYDTMTEFSKIIEKHRDEEFSKIEGPSSISLNEHDKYFFN